MSDAPSSSKSSFATPLRVARAQGALLSPTAIRPGFEVSVHECPKLLLRELKHVFPAQFERKQPTSQPTLAVLTCQRSLMDLSQFGVDADKEKDRLLETFVEFAQQVSSKLIEHKYWADFIDPCSGLPMLTLQSNKVYSEVDGVEVLLRYRCNSAGMCKILIHPSWGAAVYPASLFTNAPYELVREVIANSSFNETLKSENDTPQSEPAHEDDVAAASA
uniref:Methylmalonic aciduria and homocystinuria type D protein n=1 Tax=Globisporangium ultimum (strain ATCC 200006 / CBS 805.95 / DAOM BR144) TaxID=431595 RepID=K3WPJ2_GLOUD